VAAVLTERDAADAREVLAGEPLDDRAPHAFCLFFVRVRFRIVALAGVRREFHAALAGGKMVEASLAIRSLLPHVAVLSFVNDS
jgi:hypothetical protein